MGTIVLADRYDEQRVLEEEKSEWLDKVLIALGIDEKLLKSEDLRQTLMVFELEVWHNCDGSINVYRRDKLVAQWLVPKLILVKDSNKYYYEIHLNEWALPFQKRSRNE